MVQTASLVKVAAGVFVMGSTGLYLAQKSVQWKVRSLPHYNESLKIVFEHPKALVSGEGARGCSRFAARTLISRSYRMYSGSHWRAHFSGQCGTLRPTPQLR